ncbi:MAG: hypothetical protein U5J95_07570 [Balneolaceae bacterium]|nr:hypothetical protein [Balneolaceae bacterium]
MKSSSKFFKLLSLPVLLLVIVFLVVPSQQGYAQLKEPEVVKNPDPLTPYGQGLTNRWGIDLQINNFGIGLTGHYARIVGRYTEITLEAGMTGLRDVSEQNFQDFFTGRRVIPNKYNRAFAFPILVGLKKRLFANEIADNFRFFLSTSAGPAMAFVFPYLNDQDNNGFRTLVQNQGFVVPAEPINDFLTGWKDGYTTWGGAGEIKLGVDLGTKFKTQTTVEIGYFFYYFAGGIQILEPNKPARDSMGNLIFGGDIFVDTSNELGFPAKKFFGTPQISIIVGGLW